jgi:hypothetical protein
MQLGYVINRNYYPVPQNKKLYQLDPENTLVQIYMYMHVWHRGYIFHSQHQCDGLWPSYMHELNNNLTGSKELYHKKILVRTLPKLEESNHKKIHVVS